MSAAAPKLHEAHPDEADITISGVKLSRGQSMTVRVALQAFASSLQEEGLGDDHHGRRMTAAYLATIGELNRLLRITCR